MNFRHRGRLWIPEAPNLILGRGPCPRPTIEAQIEIPGPRMEGIYTVELIEAATGRVKQRVEMRNTIVDAGIDDMMGSAGTSGLYVTNWLAYCEVGTDNTAVANNQTALIAPFSPVTRTNSNGGTADVASSGAGNAYISFKRVRVFTESQVNGNLTEVGFFRNSTGAPMFSRQLFKDLGGTPITITKTSADQLKVTYELRMYPPTADTTGNITISGVTTSYTIRAREIDLSTAWNSSIFFQSSNFVLTTVPSWGMQAFESNTLAATTSGPSGTSTGSSSHANGAYVAGNHYRDITDIWEPGVANFGTGIGSVTMFNGGNGGQGSQMFACYFGTKILKDSTKRLTLSFRITLARYTP